MGAGGMVTAGGPGMGTMGGSIVGSSPSLEMALPKRFLGHVIGKQGKYINYVRQGNGTDIKVTDLEPNAVTPGGALRGG